MDTCTNNYTLDSKTGLMVSALVALQGNCQNVKRAESEALFALEASGILTVVFIPMDQQSVFQHLVTQRMRSHRKIYALG